jgi:adenylylsulfate kinase-like enzyme
VAKLFYEHGNVVICTFISPTREVRESVRALFGGQGFQEVYVKCSSEAAAQRDPKGLYAKAKAGEITGLTGYDGLYEEPEQPEWVIDTESQSVDEAVKTLFSGLQL